MREFSQGMVDRSGFPGHSTTAFDRMLLFAGAAETGRSGCRVVPDRQLTGTVGESVHPARSGHIGYFSKADVPLAFLASVQTE